jgi:hypothetical protein
VRYLAGAWVAIAGSAGWLLVELPPAHPVVQQCWQLVSDGADADDILDVLVSGGIRSAPSFALVRVSTTERRAVARGTATISVSQGGRDHAITASVGSAWADERIDDDVDEVILTGGPAPGSDVEFPMSAGVTMASAVHIRLAGSGHQQLNGPVSRPVPAPAELPPTESAASRPVPAPAEPPLAESAASRPVPVAAEPFPTERAAEVLPVEDSEASYDFLFGATSHPPAYDRLFGSEPLIAAAPEPPAQSGAAEPTRPPTPPIAPTTPGAPPAAAKLATAGVIDSLPWLAAAADVTPADTVESTIQPAPAATQPADDVPAEIVRTVNRSSLSRPVEPAIVGPTVLAVFCPAGHLTPAHGPSCRVCGAGVDAQQGFETARPTLGILRMSTGDVVTLDRGVLMGRAPDMAAGGDRDRPNVLRLASADNDLSRNHAEVVLDGWHVYVRDLGSTNGTVVTLPGQQPTRLRHHDMYPIQPGTTVTLADVVSFTFEVTS